MVGLRDLVAFKVFRVRPYLCLEICQAELVTKAPNRHQNHGPFTPTSSTFHGSQYKPTDQFRRKELDT